MLPLTTDKLWQKAIVPSSSFASLNMSSPLSTLKKLKRTPLQQWGKSDDHPRRALLREFQAAAAANSSSISDQNLPVTSLNNMSQNKGSTPCSPDLMSPVMQKLSSLEERVVAQAEEIRFKDKRIAALEEALRVKKEIFERRYMMLQRQVFEMESFLMDYNMIWVGSESTDAEESRQTFRSNKLWTPPENSVDRGFCVNFDLILDRTQELNLLAGEGEAYVQATTTGAQLAHKKPIDLWLYKNGIRMSDGPFRTYREQKTQQFMQDLMDGYFPSELQERFPDGVPFEVHVRRDEQFIPELQRQTFPGLGHVIQGDNGKTTRLFNAGPSHGHLSQGLLKMGQIQNIREASERVPKESSDADSSSSMILVDTPALQATESLQVNSACVASNGNVTTLKIRSEDGSCMYVLKMSFSETIGHIRQYLDKHRGGDGPSYEISSLFPLRIYDDNSQTIQTCRLTANTALLLRTSQQNMVKRWPNGFNKK